MTELPHHFWVQPHPVVQQEMAGRGQADGRAVVPPGVDRGDPRGAARGCRHLAGHGTQAGRGAGALAAGRAADTAGGLG